MRCGKHIMPETGVERFTYSGEWRYTRHFARRSRNHRAGPAPSRFLPRVFDIATIWLRLRRAGFFVALRVFVMNVTA